MTFNNPGSSQKVTAFESLLRDNCNQIRENFMDKYIFNAIGLEISKDDMNNDDQNNQVTGAHISEATGSHRT